MTEIKKSLVVPYTTKQMSDLVNNLEKYPLFLPWCKEVNIHNQTPYKTTASFSVKKLGMHFTISIIYQPESNQLIKIYLLNKGPFRSIDACWRFRALNALETQFGFELQYELNTSSRLLAWTLAPFIKNEVNGLFKEFVQQAKKKYGI